MEQEDTLVGLDIGTTKVCAVLAKIDDKNNIHIKGFGKSESTGLNKGVIVNINSAVKSIRDAIDECEQKSGHEISKVYTGIAGQHIQGLNLRGVVAVKGDHIDQDDIDRVMEAAKACNIPDKEVIHLLSQEFIVDGQDGVKDPVGMAGKRLEAKVHVVLASSTSKTNVLQSCENAGLEVADIVLEPLASSLAVLAPDEMEVGVLMLDIGGGTTDFVVYQNEFIVHTGVLPIGGNHVTKDISVGLRTPRKEAVLLKHDFGSAYSSSIDENDVIMVPGVNDRPNRKIERRMLAEVAEDRFREIFELVKHDIERAGLNEVFASGIVLTGGSCIISNIVDLAEEVFKSPVRIGQPSEINGVNEFVKSPICSTGVGLIKYALEAEGFDYPHATSASKGFPKKMRSGLSTFVKKFF